MNSIYLRGEVERALNIEWDRFAAEHPNLAAQLDREVLIEEATTQLRHDAEFNDVLIRAQACGQGLGAAVDFIQNWVGPFLRRML